MMTLHSHVIKFTIAVICLAVVQPLFAQQLPGQKMTNGNKIPVVIYTVKGNYDEVWNDLKTALNDRGLVISSISHVGEMLERTGEVLGRTKKIYGKANIMEFCSAIISRDMLERNPHFLAFCPYQIMVYTLPGHPKKIYLSYRRLIWNDNSGREVLIPVEKLLEGLINDVIEMHKEFK
ncbi:hypothetical protein BMS3Bbin05_00111 [bacterium BMS3Bbin05]|nr:hypothetical protein BMS3Bbin05_00111 [bacterium BMS3Bbin05]